MFGSLLPPSLSASTASPTARASFEVPLLRSHDSTLGQDTSPEVGSTHVCRSDDREAFEELEAAFELRVVSESVGGAAGNEAGRAIRSADRMPPGSLRGSWKRVASRLRVSVAGWRRRSSSTWEARLVVLLRKGERREKEERSEG